MKVIYLTFLFLTYGSLYTTQVKEKKFDKKKLILSENVNITKIKDPWDSIINLSINYEPFLTYAFFNPCKSYFSPSPNNRITKKYSNFFTKFKSLGLKKEDTTDSLRVIYDEKCREVLIEFQLKNETPKLIENDVLCFTATENDDYHYYIPLNVKSLALMGIVITKPKRSNNKRPALHNLAVCINIQNHTTFCFPPNLIEKMNNETASFFRNNSICASNVNTIIQLLENNSKNVPILVAIYKYLKKYQKVVTKHKNIKKYQKETTH